MSRKKLSKASEEWLWTDADKHDSFSDSSYLFPIQPLSSKQSYDSQNWGQFNPRSWVIQWGISTIDRIQLGERFLAEPLLYVMMQSLIAWLNGCSWHLPLTMAQPWTAPVSVLGHNRPTFSLFLPVQSSLFTLPWTEFFISSAVQNAKRVSIISE